MQLIASYIAQSAAPPNAPQVAVFPMMLLLILLIVVLGGIAMGIAGLVMLLRNKKQTGSGLCGKCDYSVTGLTTFTCPECDSDLREVGIKNQPAGNCGLAITFIVFGALTLFCVCGGFLVGVG